MSEGNGKPEALIYAEEAHRQSREGNYERSLFRHLGETIESQHAEIPAPAATKAQRVRELVNAGPFPGMSEAFDAHIGADVWTDPAYAPDASLWAAAWRAAKDAPAAGVPDLIVTTGETYGE